jgi:hypothetical protein
VPSIYGPAPTSQLTSLDAGNHPERHDEVWEYLDNLAPGGGDGISVLDHGAVEGTDCTAAFQAAADAASALIAGKPRGGKVKVPRGTWIINNSIVMRNPMVWQGETDYGTRILAGPSFPSDGYMFKWERLPGTSVVADENHVPGWGMHDLLLDGAGRQQLVNAVYTDFFDRGGMSNIRFRFFKGSCLVAWQSLRESVFYNLQTWMCGRGRARPIIDLYERASATDGHNLNQFTDCSFAQSMGDQLRTGSGVAGTPSQSRVHMFKGCIFHGGTDWIDAWPDNYHGDLTFTDEGDFSCRLVAENSRGIVFDACRIHLAGRGLAPLNLIEGATGASAVNSMILSNSYINNRGAPSATARTLGTVDVTADTMNVVGVITHRHHISTGSKITFTGSPPAPLVVGTNYWAIRTSDTAFKAAATKADAVAGTAINITSAGGAATVTQQDFGITAVSTAADTLTIADHRMSTEARVRVITDGTAPGGLLADGATDYFVIRVDKDTVKLAASRALADAGTAIDITSAGSGNHGLAAQHFYAHVQRGNLYWSTNIVDGFPSRAYIRLEAAGTAYVEPHSTAWVVSYPVAEGGTLVFTLPGQVVLSENNLGIVLTGPAAQTATAVRFTSGGVVGLGIVGGTSTDPVQVIGPTSVQLVVGATERMRANSTGVGFNGKTPVRPTLPAAATDAATTQALANAIRTALIDQGECL